MHMFLVNFSLEQFNSTPPVESTVGLPEEELKNCALIVKPIMPKKLDGKIALIQAVPVVRSPLPLA